MNDNQHISEQDLLNFRNKCLNQEELEQLLSHVSSCNYCSERLADIMSEEMLQAPKNLKDSILKATKRPDIQIAMKANETSKNMQLFFYSLKIGTAAVAALLLLFLSTNIPAENASSKQAIPLSQEMSMDDELDNSSASWTSVIRENLDDFSSNRMDFSNKIMNTEVTEHD